MRTAFAALDDSLVAPATMTKEASKLSGLRSSLKSILSGNNMTEREALTRMGLIGGGVGFGGAMAANELGHLHTKLHGMEQKGEDGFRSLLDKVRESLGLPANEQ